MLLHTERATRESVADGGRAFVRYGDLLDDWARVVMQLGETLSLQNVLHAKSEQIRDGHRFVDPALRRVTQSLADLDLPPRLHELTEQTWNELNKLAEPGGDTADVHATLDQLREAYVDLYAEAEAISRSSVVAAEQRVKRELKGGGRPGRPAMPSEPARVAGRQAPARPARGDPARRTPRRAQGPGPRDGDASRPPARAAEPRGTHRLRHRLAVDEAGGLRPGTTAVLRVKNEAPSLPWVLPPLLRACDHVLLVDNGSTDGTPEVAAETAARSGRADKFSQTSYPFSVARAGAEHLAQPELSVHSLSYFYNWCFAQVGTRYSWKWDGDMVLTTEGEVSMADFGWQVGDVASIIRVPRHGLYLADDRHGYLDLGLRNAEEWGFPIGPDFVFTKAFEWEIRTTPVGVRSIGLPHGLCVELKYLDGDEFAHWTDPESFATSFRNKRKRREWEVFNALRAGEVPTGVVDLSRPRAPTSSTTSPASGSRAPRPDPLVESADFVTQPRAPRPARRQYASRRLAMSATSRRP